MFIKKSILNKKILILLFLLIFVLSSCTNNQSNDSENEKPIKQDDATSSEKLSLALDDIEFNDSEDIIKLDTKYKLFTNLINVDENYYYFSLNDTSENAKEWQYIAVDRNTNKVIEYPGISNKYDFILEYGYNGKFYMGAFTSAENNTGSQLELFELAQADKPKSIYTINDPMFLQTRTSKNNIIFSYRGKGTSNICVFDLITQNVETILSTDVDEKSENYSISGDAVSGFEMSTQTIENDGFCYAISEFDNDIFGTSSKNTIYYYSFIGKNIELFESLKQPYFVEGNEYEGVVSHQYIQGYESSDFYQINGTDVSFYDIPASSTEEMDGFFGGGYLSENYLLVYSPSGFNIIDTKDKKYTNRIFTSAFDPPQKSDYPQYKEVTGFHFFENIFYFALRNSDGSISMHEISM